MSLINNIMQLLDVSYLILLSHCLWPSIVCVVVGTSLTDVLWQASKDGILDAKMSSFGLSIVIPMGYLLISVEHIIHITSNLLITANKLCNQTDFFCSLHELVIHEHNGLVFHDKQQLATHIQVCFKFVMVGLLLL